MIDCTTCVYGDYPVDVEPCKNCTEETNNYVSEDSVNYYVINDAWLKLHDFYGCSCCKYVAVDVTDDPCSICTKISTIKAKGQYSMCEVDAQKVKSASLYGKQVTLENEEELEYVATALEAIKMVADSSVNILERVIHNGEE